MPRINNINQLKFVIMITDEQIAASCQQVDDIAVQLNKVEANVVTRPLSKGMIISLMIGNCIRKRKFKDTVYGVFETVDKRDIAFSIIANAERANDLGLDTSSWTAALKDFIRKCAAKANADGITFIRVADSHLEPSPFDAKRNVFVYFFEWV